MCNGRDSFLMLIILAALLLMSMAAWSQDYIVMGAFHINIRTGPGTEHQIIGQAEKGDIFQVSGRVGDWVQIKMFSEDRRYIFSASYVYPLQKENLVSGHRMVLPDSEEKLLSLYRDIATARQQARNEANEVIPESIDPKQHLYLQLLWEDRLILDTLHNHGLQPALYDDLVLKLQEAGW